MKVALNTGQLTQPVPGGIGRYVRGLLDHLPDAKVDVVAFGPESRHALTYERWHRLRWFPVAVARAADVAVVHAPSLAVPPTGARPLVVTVHDLVFAKHPETLTRRGVAFHRRALAITRRQAAAVVVPSAFVAGELVAAGFAARDVHVIHHGIDVRPAPPDTVVDRALAELGVEPPYVLAVGTVEPRKGVPGLVAAMAAVRQRHRDTALVVAGRAGWGPAVAFPPWVRHVAHADDRHLDALYRRAALLAYPSRYEGFGLPVLEAMARGCPVVATDATSIPEVAGDAAVLVAVDNVEALAATISDVVSDERVRGELTQRGTARAAQFSWDACALAHRAVYEEAHGRARRL